MDETKKNGVLIIDDNVGNIRMLSHILKNEYTVYAAKGGQDATGAAAGFLPDVILLDIIMPEVDGYAVIAALKASEKTKDIPVIFISGLGDAAAEEKGLALGAADYITKPFSPAVVKLRVENQIQIVSLRREMEAAAEAAKASGPNGDIRSLMNAEFLRNIGHDLKTSLTRIHTNINNAADLLDYGMDRDEMLESLNDAGREIMKMADLINREINTYAEEGNRDG